MKLSTRSRYGLRLMLDLAIHQKQDFIFIKDIAQRQNLSEKYLSKLIIQLKAGNLIASARGAHGGYALIKDPSQITVREIVSALEGEISLVDCSTDVQICPRKDSCTTQKVWEGLNQSIIKYLDGITLEDLIREEQKKKNDKNSMYFI